MLLFAVFTLGYFFGVFLTLFVFARKEKAKEPVKDRTRDLSLDAADSWQVFRKLTKPNYGMGKLIEESGDIEINQALQ